MRVTIIKDDGVVGVNGVFRTVNLSTLPDGVRAVQWDGSAGHIEYDAAANSALSSISAYQSFIDQWSAAAPLPPQLPINSIPSVIFMRQARLALLQSGLLAQVDASIAAMPEASRIEWEFAATVERSHPLVSALADALPLTSQQLDDLFTLGATL